MNSIASPAPAAASPAWSPAPPLTEAALCRWLGAAAPGDAIVYFRGALARSLCPQLGLLSPADRLALARLAGRAWALCDQGLAHLVQRRRGVEDFEYLMIARRRPRRAGAPLLPQILAEAA
ncbi:hypothetical protein [Crenalkalicoccus roseus]|uniref:hypothetical protein n=1 Tax=Crenalkalicoccus roseus TaxID=1485588 RepID=UPI0010802E42|nr:hypothetical protein [Crenalkalicoccus roseus]